VSSASDSYNRGGRISIKRRGLPGRELSSLAKQQITVMKRVLLIALITVGLAFVPAQRSDAQVSVGIGGVGVGFGYPAYRYGYYNGYYPYSYGYYPYGYYRPHRYYGYSTGRSYYRYGHRVYHHNRHHYYRY
jgi:hypothetical protein